MTRDEIIRMAREAGLYHFYDSEGHCTGITNARLVDEDKARWDDRLVEMLAPFAVLVEEHLNANTIHYCHRFATLMECVMLGGVDKYWDEMGTLLDEYHKAHRQPISNKTRSD